MLQVILIMTITMAPLSHRTIASSSSSFSVFSVQEAAHSAAQSQRRPHAAHLLQLSSVTLPVPVLRLQQVTESNCVQLLQYCIQYSAEVFLLHE